MSSTFDTNSATDPSFLAIGARPARIYAQAEASNGGKNASDETTFLSRSVFAAMATLQPAHDTEPPARGGTTASWLGSLEIAADLNVDTVKARSREVCRQIPDEEVARINRDRQQLVLKKHRRGALVPYEVIQLKMLEWHLDRIGDAKHGEHIDRLERMVAEDQRIADDIGRFFEELDKRAGQEKFKTWGRRARNR